MRKCRCAVGNLIFRVPAAPSAETASMQEPFDSICVKNETVCSTRRGLCRHVIVEICAYNCQAVVARCTETVLLFAVMVHILRVAGINIDEEHESESGCGNS